MTPLIQNGRYVAHALSEGSPITSLDTVSMAWAGGDYYLLRWEGGQGFEPSRLTLVRTNADGRKDDTFGVHGSLQLSSDLFSRRCEMHWTGSALACILAGGLSSTSIHLFDDIGHPLDGSKAGTVAFGAGGGGAKAKLQPSPSFLPSYSMCTFLKRKIIEPDHKQCANS